MTAAKPSPEQPPKEGELSDDEKLDIALADSFPASEPPQIAEPKTAEDKD